MAIGTSALDVNSLVTQLITQERNQYSAPLAARETRATVQLSAVSTLKGALSSFKTAVDALKTPASTTPRAARSSNEDVFTATAGSTAAPGSYDITVLALAKAQQLASGPFAEGSTSTVGTGTLTITYGTTTFDVEIGEDQKTLAGVRNAINKAAGNTGVQATLLNTSEGTRLVLTSSKTGAANAIAVSATGGDGGLAQLAYAGTDTATMKQMTAAQDAHIKIGSFDYTSATNVIGDAIDGVTLTLKATSPQNESDSTHVPASLTVSEDKETLKKNVTNFVQAYNTLQSSLAKLRNYDAATKAAGPLLGDALLRGIESQIGLDLSNRVDGVSGAYTTLASLGITRQVDGTLAVDDAKLNKALENDSAAVAKVVASENGVAVRLSRHLEDMLKTGGALDTRTQSLNKTMETIEDDKEALDARMAVLEARYRKQFTALDGLLQQLQSTSDYLGAQLANLPGAKRD